MDILFDQVVDLPCTQQDDAYSQLRGIDELKEQLQKQAKILLNPDLLRNWSKEFHGHTIPSIEMLRNRPPLILLEGDVGTGKSTLADSFGSSLARELRISMKLMSLSLSTRGRGAVGEMTSLVTKAFEEVASETSMSREGRLKRAVILVVDEADALAQSRETMQVHHEDRAGVNALIRGIDRLTNRRSPVLVVLCTNRVSALDPAIIRRAAARFSFSRPDEQQRLEILQAHLGSTLDQEDLRELAAQTGPGNQKKYGFTCSDITHRLVPGLLLTAYPDRRVTLALAQEVIGSVAPTRPFQEEEI